MLNSKKQWKFVCANSMYELQMPMLYVTLIEAKYPTPEMPYMWSCMVVE